MEISEVMRQRHSVRDYLDKPLFTVGKDEKLCCVIAY